jgi:hypothetical protein
VKDLSERLDQAADGTMPDCGEAESAVDAAGAGCWPEKRLLPQQTGSDGLLAGPGGTGGKAWSTYWFNAQSIIQVGYRTLRVSQFFVPRGEKQQAAYGELQYRWKDGLALQFLLQAERWAAPALAPSPQTDVTTQFQISFSPKSWKLPLRKQLAAGALGIDGFH